MIVATGTFVPAEKMLFEHRRNGLMEPYEATLAKISFANDQSFRGNILEAQRQRCGICSDSVGIAGGHFRYLATPQNADFQHQTYSQELFSLYREILEPILLLIARKPASIQHH